MVFVVVGLHVEVLHLPSIDVEPFAAHVVRVAKAGVNPLLAGSMGEGIHLSHSERVTLIRTARRALDEAGFKDVPIMAGTGAGSTRETVELCKEAAEAGADFVIVITSGYFAGALAHDKKALKAFFTEVAAKSPLPVIIYNCESACGPFLHIFDEYHCLCRSRCKQWYRFRLRSHHRVG